jgi:ribosomal VAR1-like protein
MKNPLTLKLNELKKFYLLNKETNKENFKSNLKTVLYENNNKTKGSIVLHRLNKLLNLTSARKLAEARGNLKTNTPNPRNSYGGEGDSNQSGQIKLLNKGENSTLELLKINEIKKESLLNKTGYIQLFSYKENNKNKKNTLIYQYLKNTLQRISPIADTQKRNGILFNYSKTIAYNFFSPIGTSYGGVDINKDLFKINKLLFYFFKSLNCLISKPVYLHTPDKVIVQLFYYLNIPKKKVFRLFSILYFNSFRQKYLLKKSQITSLRKNSLKTKNKGVAISKIPFIKRKVRKAISRLRGKSDLERSLFFNLRKFNLAKVFTNKFQLIIEIITRKFKKPVIFQLIRLHHPYHDANILANLLSLNIRNKRKKSRIAINKIYSNKAVKTLNDPNLKSVNLIPAFLSGLNLKIGGRLMREPIIPRLTTKNFERGAISPGKVNYLDIATVTKKNRKGAYSITIKSAQNFYK